MGKLVQRTFSSPGNLCNTSWSCVRHSRLTKINFCFLHTLYSQCVSFSNYQDPKPSRNCINLNTKIRLLNTVREQLKLYETVKNSMDIVHRVMMLYRIAKIIEKDQDQVLVLEKEREKSRQGQKSSYMELMESVKRSISACQPHGLANVMWALGRLVERDHQLVKVCEKRILSCDMASFNNAGLSQIVTGCASLNLRTSEIFCKLEQDILSGHLEIFAFDNHLLSALLLTFAKTENGSLELFGVFLKEVLSRDFLWFDSRALASFVWSVAKKKFNAKNLFHRVQEEIFQRGTKDLHNAEFVQILWSFTKAEMGSREFLSFLDDELLSRGIELFENVQLVEVIWSLAKNEMTKSRVFDIVKAEILVRGINAFQIHELVLILWSFVSVKKHDQVLISEVEGKLCTSDVKNFDNGDLCQIIWSLAKAEWKESKLFDIIEAEVFARGTSQLTTEEKCMLMRGLIEAKRGSKRLYKFMVNSFSASDFRNLHKGQILECLWCLYMSGVEAQTLFDALEKELLTKRNYDFNRKQVAFLETLFKKDWKGNQLTI